MFNTRCFLKNIWHFKWFRHDQLQLYDASVYRLQWEVSTLASQSQQFKAAFQLVPAGQDSVTVPRDKHQWYCKTKYKYLVNCNNSFG